MANSEIQHPETGNIESLRQNESLRLVNNTRAVVIFGRFGVGQSNLGENLAKLLNAHLYDGGKKIRAATGNTPGTTEFMPRDVSVDEDIDAAQIRLIKAASPDRPVVIVAKLGGYNAAKLMQEDSNIKVVRILVTCDRKEAALRALRRKFKEIYRDFHTLTLQAGAGEIDSEEYAQKLEELHEIEKNTTLEKIIQDAQNRERGDSQHWGKMYPALAGVDIYNPAALVDINGKKEPLFDIRISTTRKRPGQSVEELKEKLIAGGFAQKN